MALNGLGINPGRYPDWVAGSADPGYYFTLGPNQGRPGNNTGYFCSAEGVLASFPSRFSRFWIDEQDSVWPFYLVTMMKTCKSLVSSIGSKGFIRSELVWQICFCVFGTIFGKLLAQRNAGWLPWPGHDDLAVVGWLWVKSGSQHGWIKKLNHISKFSVISAWHKATLSVHLSPINISLSLLARGSTDASSKINAFTMGHHYPHAAMLGTSHRYSY